MLKVLILVEGQTEEAFVKRLLAPGLNTHRVAPVPIVLTTKRLLTGDKCRGGHAPYPRIRKEILRLLNDSSAVRVTTMLDYCGLPPGFPGRESPIGQTASQRVLSVEKAWASDIGDPRFLAYLSLHEFEGLLFSDPEKVTDCLDSPRLAAAVSGIRSAFPTPEDINDHENTSPPRRLEALFPAYNKPFFGELIAERIGIPRMRAECPHFSSWLTSMESLGSGPPSHLALPRPD